MVRTIRRRWTAWLAAGVVATAAWAAWAASRGPAGADEPRAVGLQVVRPCGSEKGKQAYTGRRIGTTLALAITRKGVHFLGVDPKTSRLERFTDNRKTDLVDELDAEMKAWADGACCVSDDGATCLFDVRADRCPAAGATSVRFTGVLAFKTGQQGETARQKDFRIEQGSKLDTGCASWEVTGWHQANTEVVFGLATKTNPERISRIRFFTPAGKEIRVQRVEKSVVGFMGDAFHEWTYHLQFDKTVPRSLEVRAEYFKKIEIVNVAVDVTAGIGL